jgi:ketosteroid isomerase-like protein
MNVTIRMSVKRKMSVKRRMKIFVLASVSAFLLASAFGRGGAAQSTQMSLPPLPVNEKNFPRSLAPVVGAEHAFAQYSIDHGMKDAFLRFAAPDGILIRRKPVNAIEVWTQTNPAPTGLLTWWPIYADVSSAGDMGWTTGPWEFRDKPTDEKPSGNGHFFTVWRRQPDGSWKFVLDLGISHAAPATTETLLQYPSSLRKNNGANNAHVHTEAVQKSLLDAEQALSNESSSKGAGTALLARADETLRMYRNNSFPVVGLEAVRKSLKVTTEFIAWRPLKTDVAASGDLGYAYGTYEVRAKSSDEKPTEQGNYARVWKRQGGAWRVVFQVANPIPPPAQ